jgi:hypothetical protein
MVGLDVTVVPGWAFAAGLAEVERAREVHGKSPAWMSISVSAAAYAHAHDQ